MRTTKASALLKGAKDIRVALTASGPNVVDRLGLKYPPPEVDGQPLVDYGRQVQHLIHELEVAEASVVAAEDAHMKEEVRLSRVRTERDQKADRSYEKLLAARQGFDGLQGAKGGFEAIFVSGSSPRLPRKLLEQMSQSVTLLDDPAVEPRDLKVAGFKVDYSEVAADLESDKLELSVAIDRLDEQIKHTEITMLARQAALDELRSTVIWAGRSAEGLFERAGEHELAKRIRASTRRPLRPSEEKAAAKRVVDESAGEESLPTEESSGGALSSSESAAESVSGSNEPSTSES